jgi:uncharacterized Zn finger protein
MPDPNTFNNRPARQAEHPRRVRGGVKLSASKWPDRLGAPARALLDTLRPLAGAEAWERGLDYAARGQTRELLLAAGRASGRVQGLRPRAHEAALEVARFSDEQWETLIDSIVRSAKYSAKLLAGEMPDDLDRLFEAIGMPLIPPTDRVRATLDGQAVAPADEHVACLALLLVDRVNRDPLELFTLRGLAGADLVERLRDQHALASSAGASTPAPGRFHVDGPAPEPLETCLDHFWDAGPELGLVETTPRPPETPKPLLRRLGPSPFEAGKFPLVGLLATCYEVVSRDALEGPEPGDPETGDEAD